MSWEKVRLGELCKMNSGGTPRRGNPKFYGGDIPWAKIGDIESAKQGIIYGTEESITDEGLKSIGGRIFPKGSLLLAMYGSVGKVAFAGTELSTNQAILGIRIHDTKILNYSYLKYWFETIKQQLLNRAVGVALQNISLGIVKDLQIPLPPLHIQKKIANILDKADALRKKDQDLLQKYDELAQSIFIDMFGDPVKNEKGWEVKKLGDMAQSDKGSIRTGPFGSQLLLEELQDEGIPVYGIDNVQNSGFIWAKPKFITPTKFIELKGFSIYESDVLITRTGTVGRSCVAPKGIPQSIIGPNLLRVTLDQKVMLPEILSFLLNNFKSIKDKIKSLSPGATVAVFNSGNLKELRLCVIPIMMQKKFVDILKNLDMLKMFINEKNHSELLFHSLLQKAFTGELMHE